jgi:hypothetical protein
MLSNPRLRTQYATTTSARNWPECRTKQMTPQKSRVSHATDNLDNSRIPDDIASLVSLLVSKESRFITGTHKLGKSTDID